VRVANGLDRFKVSLLFTPHEKGDLLLGGTHGRQLVIWQYDKSAAHRMFQKHEALVEALVVVEGAAVMARAAREADIARTAIEARSRDGTGGGWEAASSRSGAGGVTQSPRASQLPNFLIADSASNLTDSDHAPEIFSADADGKVLRWQLDADANCDVYECVVSGATSAVLGIRIVC
jgi:hypothetical protein